MRITTDNTTLATFSLNMVGITYIRDGDSIEIDEAVVREKQSWNRLFVSAEQYILDLLRDYSPALVVDDAGADDSDAPEGVSIDRNNAGQVTQICARDDQGNPVVIWRPAGTSYPNRAYIHHRKTSHGDWAYIDLGAGVVIAQERTVDQALDLLVECGLSVEFIQAKMTLTNLLFQGAEMSPPPLTAWAKIKEISMLTTHEAAALLGVSVRRVQALIAAGKLVAERRGRDWFLDRDSVMQRKGDRAMIAVEVILERGPAYVVLGQYDRGMVGIPMGRDTRLVTPDDVRNLWDAWVGELISRDRLLTREELDAQHPGITIDHED